MIDVLITGASRGIGYETALCLSKTIPCRILAVSRNIKSLEKLSKLVNTDSIDSQLIPLQLDFEQKGFQMHLIKAIEELNFKPKIVINNAGFLVNKPFKELNENDFDRSFNVNIKSAFLIINGIINHLVPKTHIVNISSMGGFQGSVKFEGLSLYSASKAALCSLTECLAEELKPLDIQINCLALGAVQTEMLAEAFPGYQAGISASEMAKFITDFALNGNKYFNGKVLPVSSSTP